MSKAAHFAALKHPYTVVDVARLFMDTVVKLHGFPKTIVSDRVAAFCGKFWRELFRLQGVKLQYSSAYHPRSDGQTEVVNRSLECYLRCMTGDFPKQWVKWLALAELWYNTTFHSAIGMTPFQAVYGLPPPIHSPYIPGDSNNELVDRVCLSRELTLQLLRHHHMPVISLILLVDPSRSRPIYLTNKGSASTRIQPRLVRTNPIGMKLNNTS